MDSEKFAKYSKYFILLSMIFLLLALAGPYLFTKSTFCDSLDFSDTGQIGDTIGGIMNPFVSIAGVITTFLAFLMQVEANRIQKSEIERSIKETKKKEENECYHYLQILEIDLQNIIRDAELDVKSLRTYCEELGDKPLSTVKLLRTCNNNFERVKIIPRDKIYKAFELYIKPIDANWLKHFSDLYILMDFLPAAFKNLYEISDLHNKESYNIKIDVRNDFVKLGQLGDSILKNRNDFQDFHREVRILLYSYHTEVSDSSIQGKETDFSKIRDFLMDFRPQSGSTIDEQQFIYSVQEITIKINRINQSANMLLPEIKQGLFELSEKDGSYLSKISEISELIKLTQKSPI